MKFQNAVYYGRIGTILLIIKSVSSFVFELLDAVSMLDYLKLIFPLLEVIGFSFLFIFLLKMYKKILYYNDLS
jgi:hypothetical protein